MPIVANNIIVGNNVPSPVPAPPTQRSAITSHIKPVVENKTFTPKKSAYASDMMTDHKL
jgi:hypothetical protein